MPTNQAAPEVASTTTGANIRTAEAARTPTTLCRLGCTGTGSRPVYVLPRPKQEQVIAALLECGSIRGVERQTGVHRDTVMRLGLRVGRHCYLLMDKEIRNINAKLIQCDELWTYVSKHDKRLTPEEKLNDEIGSQFVFIGMDTETKLIPSFEVGKRTSATAHAFMYDLRRRIVGRPTIITDGFEGYVDAVERTFGPGADYAQLVKTFRNGHTPIREAYAPATAIVTCEPVVIQGKVDRGDISTSLIERQNCTARNYVKRLARLTLAFSKKLDGLVAALALHFCWYNFGRFHGTLRCTPAMAAGIARRPWAVADLLPAD